MEIKLFDDWTITSEGLKKQEKFDILEYFRENMMLVVLLTVVTTLIIIVLLKSILS